MLHYLCEEGYALSRDMASFLKNHTSSGTSIENVRKILLEFRRQKFVEFKEIPDSKEKVYFLAPGGLETLGKTTAEIHAHQKRLDRVRFQNIRHHFLTRKLERSICKHFEQTGTYAAKTIDEFGDDEGRLHIRMKNRGKDVHLRSDAEIVISKDESERLWMRVEIDRGTESIVPTIKNKFDSYFLYLQSDLPDKDYRTRPGCILFVISRARIETILSKLKKHPVLPCLLFLETEKLDRFAGDPSFELLNSKKEAVSLVSAAAKRESLLAFQDAVKSAGACQPGYEITVRTVFSTPMSDPFFPMLLPVDGRNLLWQPHGYVRIRKRAGISGFQDVFFALLFSAEIEKASENIGRILLPYERFLCEGTHLARIVPSPVHCGCIAIARDETETDGLDRMTRPLQLHARTRIVLVSDCTSEKILSAPVFRTETGSRISMFKQVSPDQKTPFPP